MIDELLKTVCIDMSLPFWFQNGIPDFCVVISTLASYYMQMKDDPKFVEAPVICQEKHQLAEKLLLL